MCVHFTHITHADLADYSFRSRESVMWCWMFELREIHNICIHMYKIWEEEEGKKRIDTLKQNRKQNQVYFVPLYGVSGIRNIYKSQHMPSNILHTRKKNTQKNMILLNITTNMTTTTATATVAAEKTWKEIRMDENNNMRESCLWIALEHEERNGLRI